VRAGLYLRVSTDDQTTQNQQRELEAAAARTGWDVVATFEDAGISGAMAATNGPDLIGCTVPLFGAKSTQ
jgi:DNA invertase Pin-like site-specific DNA recombinase